MVQNQENPYSVTPTPGEETTPFWQLLNFFGGKKANCNGKQADQAAMSAETTTPKGDSGFSAASEEQKEP